MKRALDLFAIGAVLVAAMPARAQMTIEQAREAGKALGAEKRSDSSIVPSSDAQAAAVPGYAGTSLPQNAYYDDPERLEAAGQSTKSTNEQYRITTDADSTRPAFSNSDILATTSRATAVENDPSAYLAGEAVGGSQGSCVPLPPGTGSNIYYEAACNAGSKVEQVTSRCLVPQVPQFEEKSAFTYSCGLWYNEVLHQGTQWFANASSSSCAGFEMTPVCTLHSSEFVEERRYVGRLNKDRSLYTSSLVRTYSCTGPAASANGARYCDAFGCFTPAPVVELEGGSTKIYTGAKEDLSLCAGAVQAGACLLTTSVCTDSGPRNA